MTKDEMKKEAIQYAIDYPTSYGKGYKHKDLRIAYLAGAEPREKRIAELEKELKAEKEYSATLRKEIDEFTNSHTLCAKYKELEKAYNEAEELLDKQIEATYKLFEENKELKEKAKEIICEYVRLANLEKEDTIAIWQLYHKAEQFLKECE